MAMTTRGQARRAQPPPPFILLPDIAHATIASFLPDGDDKQDNRLRVSEVSHALRDSYGGSLTSASLYYSDGRSSSLVALLRRQKKLKTLSLEGQRTFPAVFKAIHRGCCRGVENLRLDGGSQRKVTPKRMNDLVEALQVEGALPALRRLEIVFFHAQGVLPMLAQALKGGTLPLLEHFDVRAEATISDMDIVLDMVEARAQIPGCQRFVMFNVSCKWLRYASLATRIRLLRALLPSLKELRFSWNAAYEACFRDVRPPSFEALRVGVPHDGTAPSFEVLETMPSLQTIDYFFNEYRNILGAASFQPVNTALQRGVGLKFLQEVTLVFCDLGDVNFRDFLEALEGSGCAERMTVLSFTSCRIGVEGARTLADQLRRDGLPALENLRLSFNHGIGDEGVVALVNALEEPPRTSLVELHLCSVEMGDLGMAALASLVHQGRLRRLQALDLSRARGVTNETIVDLSLAIEERRLIKLRKFNLGFQKIGTAYTGLPLLMESLAKNCPELKDIDMRYGDNMDEADWLREVILDSLRDAGRTAKVYVYYHS